MHGVHLLLKFSDNASTHFYHVSSFVVFVGFSQTILFKIYVAADRRNSFRLLTVKCDWDFKGGGHYGFLFSLWYAVCNAVFLKQ